MNGSLKPSKTAKQPNLCLVFTVYWIVLLAWQNLFNTQLQGAADALLKMCLLAFLTFSFLRCSIMIKKSSFILWAVFVASQLVTFLLCDLELFSFGILVSYVYPALMLFLVYCIGGDSIVTKRQIDGMNNAVLIVLAVSIVYTLVFEPDQYITALTAKDSGYGNELTGIFISMHEYAQYLFYGIAVCLDRIGNRKFNPIINAILIAALTITLICTFSRTAIVGFLVYLVVYAVMGYKTKKGRVVLIGLTVVALIIICVPIFREYAYRVVWKSGNTSSRNELFAFAIDYFKNSDLFHQIFGNGISSVRSDFLSQIGYGSVHNGFIQVLLYYGIAGLVFLIGLYVQQFIEIVRFFKIDKGVALFSLGMLIFTFVSMIPNTMVIFTSSIECYFMTVMMIVIPHYQRNAVLKGKYV